MLVRVPVIGTVGKAVRLNPDATVGGQVGVNITLPDGSLPTFEELALALNAQLPPVLLDGNVLETQILDGFILARVADNEQITGLYNFVNGVTALSYDGILAANLLDKTATETISATWTHTGNINLSDGVDQLAISTSAGVVLFQPTGGLTLVRFNVDVDMPQGITAATYGGILEANLVDKSAVETIPGVWDFSAGATYSGGLDIITGAVLRIFDTSNVDHADFSHDGVDFNSDFVNTTDWNITGIVRMLAATMDIQVDAITATSYGGIAQANLVDKSVAEFLNGAWDFGGGLRVTSGSVFGIMNSTGTDRADFSHDGVDFITNFINTADWNITGITSIQAGLVDVDFDAITATSYGGILEANLLDKTAAETVDQIWTFARTSGVKLIFKDTDSTGNAVTNFMEFKDSADFRQGWFGYGSSSNDDVTLNNALGDIVLTATNTRVTGALVAVSYEGILAANLVDRTAAGALVATSYDGVLAANLLDKIANETISGVYTHTGNLNLSDGVDQVALSASSGVLTFQPTGGFSSVNFNLAVTGQSFAGITSANLLDKSAAETVSGAWEYTNVAGWVVTNTNPRIIFDDTNAAAEQGVFAISADAEQFRISLMNDARGSSTTVMNVERTGLTSDQITFTATVIRTGAKMIFDGKLFVTEAATAATSETGRGQYWVRSDVPNAPMFTNENSVNQLLDPSRSEIVGKTASYTLVIGDKGKTIRFTGTTASKVLTIPANAAVAFMDGTLVAVHNDGTVAMTIVITTDTLTWAKDNATGTRTLAPGATAVLQKVAGTNWKIAGSALVT